MKKRIIALLLCLVMCVSLLPATAMAEETSLFSVSFVCFPEDAVVTVFDGEEIVPAEEDGSYLLPEGTYCYSASHEGFLPIEREPFDVCAGQDEVFVILTAVEDVEEPEESEEPEEPEASEQPEQPEQSEEPDEPEEPELPEEPEEPEEPELP